MRFFASIITASLVAVATGLVISRDVEVEAPIDIKEACRGVQRWHSDGFYRSGTTVRYHGHMWQCTRWNKGKENPEDSEVWRDLGACDPDVMNGQMVFGKRSTPLETRDIEDCNGFREWDAGALERSGTTVRHKDSLWQTNKWNKGEEPGVSSDWTVIHACGSSSKKVKRACNGFPTVVEGALIRPGSTFQHDNKLYQSKVWTHASTDDTKAWALLGDC